MTTKRELLEFIHKDREFFWVNDTLTLADLRSIVKEIMEHKVAKELSKLNADPWGFNQKGWLNKKGSGKKGN